MGEDAERTLTALRRLRAELFGPAVAGHRGTLVKSMGDGWIVTFASAVDAVTCAMRLQDKMADEPKIKLRIGIHIGDIAVEDEDVFGEGVNVAARLEALTQPGGLTISDAVFGTLDGTLRPAFDDAGEQSLKNIDRPLRVWSRGGVMSRARATPPGSSGFPCLQIVPVMAPDVAGPIRDLSSALTHDIEACLVHHRWLRAAVALEPVPETFTLKSTLRNSGDTIRFEARLTAPDGTPVWNRKYDGSLGNVFDWQDETGADAASRVSAAVLDMELARILRKTDDSLSGEDWMLKAATMTDGSRAAVSGLFDCTTHAIEKNPDLSYAYELALAMMAAASSFGYTDIVARYQPLLPEWLARARELSTGTPAFQAILALFSYVQSGDVEAARKDVASNLRNLPFDPDALLFTGYVFNFIGEAQNALECFDKFHTIARHHHYAPPAHNGAGAARVMVGRYEDALVHLNEANRLASGYVAAYRWRAAALAHLGRLEEAREMLAQHDALLPGQTIASVRAGSRYVINDATDRYFDGLRLAGMPD